MSTGSSCWVYYPGTLSFPSHCSSNDVEMFNRSSNQLYNLALKIGYKDNSHRYGHHLKFQSIFYIYIYPMPHAMKLQDRWMLQLYFHFNIFHSSTDVGKLMWIIIIYVPWNRWCPGSHGEFINSLSPGWISVWSCEPHHILKRLFLIEWKCFTFGNNFFEMCFLYRVWLTASHHWFAWVVAWLHRSNNPLTEPIMHEAFWCTYALSGLSELTMRIVLIHINFINHTLSLPTIWYDSLCSIRKKNLINLNIFYKFCYF